MGRAPCCEKNGLKKGPWTPEEDEKLIAYIKNHGQGNWRTLPKNAGLSRCGKSCRLRWTNYLRPDIKRGRFSFEEEETIIQLHSILGNKWSAIAARLPGRTDNEIKNYWNTHIRKRLLRMGIDPVTHASRLDLSSLLKTSAGGGGYYPTQSDLDTLRTLEPLVNSEILRLASSLLTQQPHIPSGHAQVQELLPWLLQAQMAQSMAQGAAPGTTQATQLLDEGQLMQANVAGQMPSLVQAQIVQDLACNFGNNCVPAAVTTAPSYDNLDPAGLIQYWNNQQNCNFGSSGMSTPASSPATQLNSSSTTYNINGSNVTTEVDSGDMFNMQLSELLDVSDYM